MTKTRPPLTGLASMTFQSSNLPEALRYYRDVHGWEDHFLKTDPKGSLTAAFIKINPRQWVELRPETAPHTDRLIQFALETADAEALRRYLEASGWAVPSGTTVNALGNRSFTVLDPDGHPVEFVELTADGWPLRTRGGPADPLALSTVMMHLGFDVASLDKAMGFYRDLLGCREFWRGSQNDKTLAWVQLALPDDQNYIEFMLYDEPPSLQQLGVFNHFGLEVFNMFETMEEASRRIGPQPYPRTVEYSVGKCHHRLANVYDPDGTRAEFMERRTYDNKPAPASTLPAPR